MSDTSSSADSADDQPGQYRRPTYRRRVFALLDERTHVAQPVVRLDALVDGADARAMPGDGAVLALPQRTLGLHLEAEQARLGREDDLRGRRRLLARLERERLSQQQSLPSPAPPLLVARRRRVLIAV